MSVLKPLYGLCLASALAMAGFAFAGIAAAESPQSKMAPAPMKAAATPATGLLDINSASKADLIALKGVGEKRAADIIKGRPYKGKDELVQKNIIPAGVYADIKDKIIAKQK